MTNTLTTRPQPKVPHRPHAATRPTRRSRCSDFGLFIAAIALARLATTFDRPPTSADIRS